MKITATTRLVCVVGHPIRHSLSPVMQNAAFQALGLNYCYLAFDIPSVCLTAAIEGLRAMGVEGINVTIPHKQTVRNYIDEMDPDALLVGAVNTLAKRGPGWVGYNTDIAGFLAALNDTISFPLQHTSAVLLGAGGGARAVCVGLGRAGVTEVTVVNRTLDRAASLVEALQPHVPQTVFTAVQWGDPGLGEAFARAKLLVNSTSVGMSAIEGEESWTQALLTFKQLPLDRLATDAFFYDLVYEPKTTPFMALGMAAGHGVQNGLGMLIHQGAEAFRIWTRRDPPIDVMRNAVNQARSDS